MRLSKSIKIVQRKTPGGRTVEHLKKERFSYTLCRNCGAKLNKSRLNPKKLSKVERRSERPFSDLCPRCMKKVLKEMVRK